MAGFRDAVFQAFGIIGLDDSEARQGLRRTGKEAERFSAKFEKELEGAAGSFDGFASKLVAGAGGIAKGLAGAAAGLAAGAAAVATFGVKVGETARQLDNAARGLDLTVREFSQLNRVFGSLDIDDVNASLRTFNEALTDAATGGTAQKEALEILGVAYQNADGTIRPLTDVLDDVTEAMGRADSGVRLFAGNILFGEDDFRKLDAILQDLAASGTSVTEAMQEYEGVGQATVDANRAMADAFSDLRKMAGEAAFQLGELIAPTVLNWFSQLAGLTERVTKLLRGMRSEAQKLTAETSEVVEQIRKQTDAEEVRKIVTLEQEILTDRMIDARDRLNRLEAKAADLKERNINLSQADKTAIRETQKEIDSITAAREELTKAEADWQQASERGPVILREFGKAAKETAERVREAALSTSEFLRIMRELVVAETDWDRRREAIRRDVERRRQEAADADAAVTPGIVEITPEARARQEAIAAEVRRRAEEQRVAVVTMWDRIAGSIGDFVRRSQTSLEGLATYGVGAIFGREGAYDNFKQRLRNMGEDLARFFAGRALQALIGGRGRRGALEQVQDGAAGAAVGVSTLFEGVATAAGEADRGVGRLAGSLASLGGFGVPGLGGGLNINLGAVFGRIWDGIRAVWTEFLQPVGRSIWEVVAAVVTPVWTEFLKPVGRGIWTVLKPVLLPLWTEFLKPVGRGIWNLVKAVVEPLWRVFFRPPQVGVPIPITRGAESVLPNIPGGGGGGEAPVPGTGAGGAGFVGWASLFTGIADAVVGGIQRSKQLRELNEISRQTVIIARLLGHQGQVVGEESVARAHSFTVLGETITRAWEDTIHGNLRNIAVNMAEMEVRISSILGTVRPWFLAQSNLDVTRALFEAREPLGTPDTGTRLAELLQDIALYTRETRDAVRGLEMPEAPAPGLAQQDATVDLLSRLVTQGNAG